ncbi:hypothetical protein BJ138DRAFT_1013447, partial [Hygrophoropsis aurantiaca]
MKDICAHHGIPAKARLNDSDRVSLVTLLSGHSTEQECCRDVVTIFKFSKVLAPKADSPKFPPDPPTLSLQKQIIGRFCESIASERLIEEGCTVCGRLNTMNSLTPLDQIDVTLMDILCRPGLKYTRVERRHLSNAIVKQQGPVIDPSCNKICSYCLIELRKRRLPVLSLANGLWIGTVPDELKGLSYVEKLLVARVRHNRCIVRVASSGMNKMSANAISFKHPTPKIY